MHLKVVLCLRDTLGVVLHPQMSQVLAVLVLEKLLHFDNDLQGQLSDIEHEVRTDGFELLEVSVVFRHLDQLLQVVLSLHDQVLQGSFHFIVISDVLKVILKLSDDVLLQLGEVLALELLVDAVQHVLLLALWVLVSFPVLLDQLNYSTDLVGVTDAVDILLVVDISEVIVNCCHTRRPLHILLLWHGCVSKSHYRMW